MARPSATAALLLLALSLLAVAADHDTEPKPVAAMAVSDDNGLSSNTTRPAKDGASATEEKVRPAEQHHGIEFLRLPSHRLHRHRPCSLHGHLWWKRQHGVYGAPRRFHDDHYSGHGERREAVSHLAILPAAAEDVKPVAEPDPDRSLPDSDGEGELVATRDPPSFVDTDAHDSERAAAVKAWKKEVLRRWFHFNFHHGMRRHRLHHVHHDEEEEEEEEAAPETEGMKMKRFQVHHHHHHHEEDDDEEKNIVRKRLRHAEHGNDKDSDDDDKQTEEMVRRFRKAIMCHGHGRRFFHHNHRHRHAEEAEKQAGGEQSGVIAWIRGLMNRF